MPNFNPTAFNWGAKAAREGLDPCDNPYISHREREQWDAGYDAGSLDDHEEADERRAA